MNTMRKYVFTFQIYEALLILTSLAVKLYSLLQHLPDELFFNGHSYEAQFLNQSSQTHVWYFPQMPEQRN